MKILYRSLTVILFLVISCSTFAQGQNVDTLHNFNLQNTWRHFLYSGTTGSCNFGYLFGHSCEESIGFAEKFYPSDTVKIKGVMAYIATDDANISSTDSISLKIYGVSGQKIGNEMTSEKISFQDIKKVPIFGINTYSRFTTVMFSNEVTTNKGFYASIELPIYEAVTSKPEDTLSLRTTDHNGTGPSNDTANIRNMVKTQSGWLEAEMRTGQNVFLYLAPIVETHSTSTSDPLNASFTYSHKNEGCVPDTIEFMNNSTGANHYKWHFENGTTDTNTNPTKVYTTTGEYRVTLKAISNSDTSTMVDTITIADTVNAEISVSPQTVCPTVPLDFNGNPNYDQYTWDFGDGQTGSGISASHAYDSGGTYEVKLVVSNSCGTDTASQSVSIKNASQPDFSANVACVGDTTYFKDLSSPTPSSWTWTLGNGDSSMQQNPKVLYDSAKEYKVTLTVTRNNCTLSKTKQILVSDKPADASFTDSTSSLTVHLENTSSREDSVRWEFGDNSGSSAFNPSHTYDSGGKYKVCLYAFNGCGMDSTCKTIQVKNTTSIVGKEEREQIKIYPNPADNSLNINIDQQIQLTNFQLINTVGKSIRTFDKPGNGKNQHTLNVGNIKPGVYFLKFQLENGRNITKELLIR